MTPPKIRILVVDDHTLFREGLTALLQSAADIEVVGEASSGVEAIALAAELQPDIILMDIRMEHVNGIEATRRIRQEQPGVRVIMLTMVERDDSLLAALRAGAQSYILKGADKKQVLKTIYAVAEGEALFGPEIAQRLGDFFRGLDVSLVSKTELALLAELSDREREVLDLMARSWNNQQIAAELHISPKTVSNHVSNIFNKLQVADRVQAIDKAREAGLGQEST
jgi:DNA-binding NarL/FixJ family response regulator